MGKQQGFTGVWNILCAIMFSLVRFLQPTFLLHECTARFPYRVIDAVVGKTHVDFHSTLSPVFFGAPVKRLRCYDSVVTWHDYWT